MVCTHSNLLPKWFETDPILRKVTGLLYIDTATYGGFTANQVIGSATGTALIPSNGIIGFSKQEVQFPFQDPNLTIAMIFMETLCTQSIASECRFGLALTDYGPGTLAWGQIEDSLYPGDLSAVPSFSSGR